MNETTFENAQVGDRVWDFRYGWGTVSKIEEGKRHQLKVDLDYGAYLYFTFTGQYIESDLNRTLFWDEVKFEAPPRPKRKTKKTIEGWAHIHKDGRVGIYAHCVPEDLAREAQITCVKLIGEYEVEE